MKSSALRQALLCLALSTLLVTSALPVFANGETDKRGEKPSVFSHEIPNGTTTFFSTDSFGSLFGPRAVIGLELVDITPELRQHFGADKAAGVLVSRVVDDGPADRAGVRVGDLISAIDGEPMKSAHQLGAAIRQHDEGDTVDIEVWRNGRLQQLSSGVEIQEPAAQFPANFGHLSKLPSGQLRLKTKVSTPKDGWKFRMSPDSWRDFSVSMNELQRSLNDPAFKGRFESLRRDRKGLEEKIEHLENRLQELEERLQSIDER